MAGLNVNDIRLDVLDRINQPENGELSIDRFNRYSWIAQLSLLDWLSGDISAKEPPEPYLSSKNKSWLSPFIATYPVQVIDGKVVKPPDYYNSENTYLLGQFNEVSRCYEPVEDNGVQKNTPITILDGDKFTERSNTYIDELKPTFKTPIAKIVGNSFQFNPTDLGSIVIEYIRYPKKSMLKTKFDAVYYQDVYDEQNSIDFEWEEYARPILTWYICDLFFDYTREQAGKQFNAATGKTARP
jgi:hypothetical protein